MLIKKKQSSTPAIQGEKVAVGLVWDLPKRCLKNSNYAAPLEKAVLVLVLVLYVGGLWMEGEEGNSTTGLTLTFGIGHQRGRSFKSRHLSLSHYWSWTRVSGWAGAVVG